MSANITYSLEQNRAGVISGIISIGEKEYRLETIPEDIVEALSAVIGQNAMAGFFLKNPIETVDDITSKYYRKHALEVKLKLLACMKELDEQNAARFEAFERYNSDKEDLQEQYRDDLIRLEKRLHDTLKKLKGSE